MWEVQKFRFQGASTAEQNQRTLFQLSATTTPSREMPMWTRASLFVESRKSASSQQSSEKIGFSNNRKANAKEQGKVTSGASSSNAEKITIDQKITAAPSYEDKRQEIFINTATAPVNVQGEIVYLQAILDTE